MLFTPLKNLFKHFANTTFEQILTLQQIIYLILRKEMLFTVCVLLQLRTTPKEEITEKQQLFGICRPTNSN